MLKRPIPCLCHLLHQIADRKTRPQWRQLKQTSPSPNPRACPIFLGYENIGLGLARGHEKELNLTVLDPAPFIYSGSFFRCQLLLACCI